MITKEINGKKFLFAEVPEWATYFEPGSVNLYYSDAQPNGKWATLKFTERWQWKLIGKASELSESQWKEIVHKGKVPADLYFLDYEWEGIHNNEKYNKVSATESGLSLIKSIGYTPETTLILIQQ
jgi:hypothetical protein